MLEPIDPSTYRILFARARREESLLIMVKAKLRECNAFYDESIRSYKAAAREYTQLGATRPATILQAAAERLNRIKEKNNGRP